MTTRQGLIRQRLTLGLTQTALARRAGVSTTTVFHVENGSLPRAINIPPLATAYDMTPHAFVDELFKEMEK